MEEDNSESKRLEKFHFEDSKKPFNMNANFEFERSK